MPIKKLPHEVQSLLRASPQINTFKKAVEELVYNSLDGGSTSIAIRVNVQEGTIQVIDNGCGIQHSDIRSVGQRHMTSNYVDASTLKSASDKYGLKGEALAHIIAVSKVVNIVSRIPDTERTWMKTFLYGRENKIAIASTRASKGTTVEIKGFLYNLDIKKKIINSIDELQNMRTFLEQLSLIYNNISLSLRDDTKNEIIFQIHKKRDIYQTLHTLFNIEKKNIQELKVEKNEYKVTGYIGKHEQGKHWIYLNRKIILASSKLYKIVNNYISKRMSNRIKIKVKSKAFIKDDENNLFTNTIPFYFILISCPYLDYDFSHTPNQSLLEFNDWTKITILLEKLIKFCFGDLNLKPITNPEHGIINLEESEMKNQIKRIVNKVLGNKSVKPCISKMQNGVKGKLVKSKKKKKLPAIAMSKITSAPVRDNSSRPINIPIITAGGSHNNGKTKSMLKTYKQKKIKNKFSKISPVLQPRIHTKPDKTQNIPDLIFEIDHTTENKQKDRVNKNIIDTKIHDNKRKKSDCINSKSSITDPIIKRFEESTDSIKQRCVLIAKETDKMLSEFNKTQRQLIRNGTIENCSSTKYNKDLTVRKNNDEIVTRDYYSKTLEDSIDYRIWKKPIKSFYLTNYDLVHTILQSQDKTKLHQMENKYYLQKPKEFVYSPIHIESGSIPYSTIESGLIPYPTPNETRHRYHEGNLFLGDSLCSQTSMPINNDMNISMESNFFYSKRPKLTYESHRYKACDQNFKECLSHNNNKPNKRYRFINKFVFNEKHSKSSHRHKFKKPTVTRKISMLGKSRMLSKLCHSKYDSAISSYTIEFSGNVGTFNNRRDTTLNNVKNDLEKKIRLNSVHNLTYNVPNKSKTLYSTYELIENTYEVSGPINNLQKESRTVEKILHCKQQTNYFIGDSETKSSFISTMISPINFNKNGDALKHNHLNVVFISDSQKSDKEDNTLPKYSLEDNSMHPMDICETVLSNVDINSEFDKSFTFNHLNDSIFNCEFSKKHEEISLSLKAIKSNSKQVATNMDYMDIKNIEHDLIIPLNDVGTKYIKAQNAFPKDIQAVNFNFDMKNRLRFLPKGMSQIFENCNTKTACDYKLVEDYFNNSIYNNFANDVQINSEIYEPSIQNLKEASTKGIDKFNTKLVQDNASLKFSAQQLKDSKVLEQVDGKFISAIIDGHCSRSDQKSKFLVLFDQHAVDERIQLEQNLSDYVSNNQWSSVAIEFSLVLSKEELIALHNYKDKFEQFGLQWTILDNNEVKIDSIPLAVLGKHSRQMKKISKTIKTLIAEEVDVIKIQKGCISLYPKSIMDLVFSEACRYAVKFGDNLSKADCEELLKNLSACKTPFQCAHGRPVMAVLTNYTNNVAGYKINIEKLKGIKSMYKK